MISGGFIYFESVGRLGDGTVQFDIFDGIRKVKFGSTSNRRDFHQELSLSSR